MIEYFFDISYVQEKDNCNLLLESITKKYDNIKLYAKDFGKRSSDGKSVCNCAFRSKSLENIFNMCKDIVKVKSLYIDFINKGDADEESDVTEEYNESTEDSDENIEEEISEDIEADSEISEKSLSDNMCSNDTDSSFSDDENNQIYASNHRYKEINGKYQKKYDQNKDKLQGLEKEINEFLTKHNNDKF